MNVNDVLAALALEIAEKRLTIAQLRAQLDVANARIAELEPPPQSPPSKATPRKATPRKAAAK